MSAVQTAIDIMGVLFIPVTLALASLRSRVKVSGSDNVVIQTMMNSKGSSQTAPSATEQAQCDYCGASK